jgi:hypothetical protein
MPEVLTGALSKAANQRKCSKAEVVRTALYEHLKRFIEADENGS